MTGVDGGGFFLAAIRFEPISEWFLDFGRIYPVALTRLWKIGRLKL